MRNRRNGEHSRGGTPVDRVSVYVQPGTGPERPRGRFTMEIPTPGPKQVQFSALGYATRTETIEVEMDRVTNVRVSLSPDPVELNPIEVTVERREFALQDAGYYTRQAEGFGNFIDRENRGPAAAEYDVFQPSPGGPSLRGSGQRLEKYSCCAADESAFSSGPYGRVSARGARWPVINREREPAMLDRMLDPGHRGRQVFQTASGSSGAVGGIGSSCGAF